MQGGTPLTGAIARSRELVERRNRRWRRAAADMRRRVDEVMFALPSCLAKSIPESMQRWPEHLLLGIMIEYVEKRLSEEGGDPASIQSEADRVHDGSSATVDAARVEAYVSDHMRMPFRPYGRKRLIALVAKHLEEVGAEGDAQ